MKSKPAARSSGLRWTSPSPCPRCQPVPGERIVGITHRGQGVVVHAIDCSVLVDYEPAVDRLHWHEGTHSPTNTITLEMTITNDAGVWAEYTYRKGRQHLRLGFRDRKPDYFRLLIELTCAM
jgi:(p)ppGpp synthase/HD superfamily hydrolase